MEERPTNVASVPRSSFFDLGKHLGITFFFCHMRSKGSQWDFLLISRCHYDEPKFVYQTDSNWSLVLTSFGRDLFLFFILFI